MKANNCSHILQTLTASQLAAVMSSIVASEFNHRPNMYVSYGCSNETLEVIESMESSREWLYGLQFEAGITAGLGVDVRLAGELSQLLQRGLEEEQCLYNVFCLSKSMYPNGRFSMPQTTLALILVLLVNLSSFVRGNYSKIPRNPYYYSVKGETHVMKDLN